MRFNTQNLFESRQEKHTNCKYIINLTKHILSLSVVSMALQLMQFISVQKFKPLLIFFST